MPWPTMTDFQEAIQNPRFCFADVELQQGVPETDTLGLPKAISGNFAVVFPVICNGKKWAVRCFSTYHQDQGRRYELISDYLKSRRLPWMVGFQFLNQGIRVKGQWYPILKMEWVGGETLTTYIEKSLGDPKAISSVAEQFANMVTSLRMHNIAHGDLQHGNILVVNGDIRLIDYDGMFVPGLEGESSHELGHRNYQCPRRTGADFGTYLDNFSAWVIYVSLIALSIDATLWARVRQSDECILLSRDDFENPASSEAMRALDRMPHSYFPPVASLLHSFFYSNVANIPPLDVSHFLPALPNTRQASNVATGSQSGGAAWVLDHIEPKTPVHAAWVLDHIEPKTPVHIDTSPVLERLVMTGFAAILFLLAFVAPAISVFTVGSGLAVLLAFFYHRFRSLQVVSGKIRLQSSLQNIQVQIERLDNAMKRLSDDKNKLDSREEQKVNEVNTRRQALAMTAKNETDSIDWNLDRRLRWVSSTRQTLGREETNEISQALTNFQNQFLANQLARYDLARARITGIGVEMKRRLSAAGVRTAADIIDVRVMQTTRGGYSSSTAYLEIQGRGRIHVDGIGPEKALDLLAWRRGLESAMRARLPLLLPQPDESAIRSKYQSRRQSLDRQEADGKQDARQMKDAVQVKYRGEQDRLATQLKSIQGQFTRERLGLDQQLNEIKKLLSEKNWELAGQKRELVAYRGVSFASYLKHILSSRGPS